MPSDPKVRKSRDHSLSETSETQLDALSEVSAHDIERAAQRFRDVTLAPYATLLDGPGVPDEEPV